MKQNNSLVEGPILRGILFFTFPILLGSLFQTLYNIADTVIVGRLLGLESLAAVGATGSVNFLVLGFVSGMCAGMAIPVSQRFGAGEYSSMRSYVANAALLALALSLVMTPVLFRYTGKIMLLMRTPEDIIDGASLYIGVIFLGIPATFLYNTAACVLRSVGDSKSPLFFLLFSSVLNVGLDIVSVTVLHMDVRGPAWATVVSQLISGILCVLWIRHRHSLLRLKREELRPDSRKISRLLSSGVPMGLQYSITAVGSVLLAASVNTLGSTAVASVTVASRINMLLGNSEMDSLGTAMATFTGQNYGARNYGRIRSGARQAMLAGFVYDAIALVIALLFSNQLARLFLAGSADAEAVIRQARQMCCIIATSYSMLCILSVLRFSLQGLGHSSLAMLSGVAEMLARSLIALVFVPRFGFIGACFGNSLAWLFADLTLCVCWFPIIRRVKRELTGDVPLSFENA